MAQKATGRIEAPSRIADLAGLVHGLPAKVALCATSVASLPFALSGALPGIEGSLVTGLGAGTLVAAAASLIAKLRADPVGAVGVLPQVSKGFVMKGTSRSADRLQLLTSLDRSIDAIQKTREHEAKLQALDEARLALRELAPDLGRWSGDVRLRVYVLLRTVSRVMQNPRYTSSCLVLVNTILQHGGRSAAELVKSTIGGKVRSLCDSGYFLPESAASDLETALDSFSYEELPATVNERIMKESEAFSKLTVNRHGDGSVTLAFKGVRG